MELSLNDDKEGGMETEKQQVLRVADTFDELDALTTIVSCVSDMSEANAKAFIQHRLDVGDAEEKAAIQEYLDDLKSSLPVRFLPASVKREAFRRAILSIKNKQAQQAALQSVRGSPGCLMLGIASAVFSKKKVERVFTPLVADYRMELAEAIAEGRFEAIKVKIEYWIAFWKACGLDKFLELLHKIMKLAGY